MDSLEQNIRLLVERVVTDMALEGQPDAPDAGTRAEPVEVKGPGIFSDIDSAVAAATTAQRRLIEMSLEKRKEFIAAMRTSILENNERISRQTQEESGLGCYHDKMVKNELAAKNTPGVEDLEPICFTGDHGMTLVERAPYGVIGSIIPCTNPVATVVNNSIGMIAGGNAVVFNPHPLSKAVSCMAISIMDEAIVKAGGPANLLTSIGNPTIESANELMKHEDVALLAVTGGPGVVKVAMNSGKKVVAAGPGNPPCVVDETADIEKAGRDIVAGASFDNNIVCICEKEVIVVNLMADRLKEEMRKNGAYELSGEQIDSVTKLVVAEPGAPGKEGFPNKEFVGKRAHFIAKAIGLDVPETTKLLLCDVAREHPLVWTEQLMPVIPLVRVGDVDDAIELARECEHGYRHTAVMHSLNVEKLSKMARVMNCSLFVKNGPCYAGLGNGGEGYTSFTIASPTGEGLTRARTFTRERRCTLVDYFRIV